MTTTFTVDPSVTHLLRAVGLLDDDGQLDETWFQDPLGALGQVLADPGQKAALWALLGDLLPPVATSPSGSAWHPLLDVEGIGNLYLTVTGDVLGLAAAARMPEPDPPATGAEPDLTPRAGLRLELPLLNTAGGDVIPIAATVAGPLQLALDLDFADGADLPLTALRVAATVTLDGGAGVRVVLEGVEVGGATQTVTLSTDSTGDELTVGLETLVRAVLEAVTDDPTIGYLLGLLGLGGDAARPPLPLVELFEDPAAAMRGWLAELASAPAILEGWFGDLAQLLGGEAPPAPATGQPTRARIVELADDVWLELTLERVADELRLGLDLAAAEGGRSLEASVTVLAVPLVAGPPVRAVPDAALRVRVAGDGPSAARAPLARTPATGAPDFQVREVAGGVRFDGTGVEPELVATGVVLGPGQSERTVDLTDANSVAAAASAGISGAIESALGTDGPAPALLALIGLAPPRSVTGTAANDWPTLDLAKLASGPAAAIGAFHREVLADSATHSWRHLLGELGLLLGLTATVDGTGTEPDPWAVTLAQAGAVRVDVTAWDARLPGDPTGTHRLRLGVRVEAGVAPWSGIALGELLAFDLAESGPGEVRFIGRQRLSLELQPTGPLEADGVELQLDRVEASASWTPGLPLQVELAVRDLELTADGQTAGPATLRLDPTAADLGLATSAQQLWPVVRLLGFHALRRWGGEGAAAIGSLLGLDGALAPLELPVDGDLASLFADVPTLLRTRLRGLVLATDAATGRPAPELLWTRVAALLRDEVGGAASGLTVTIAGSGTYDDPWSFPIAADSGDALDVIAWLDPDGPPRDWAAALGTRLQSLAAPVAADLVAVLPEARGFLGSLPAWATDAPGLAAAIDGLAGWLAASDGVVPLAAQLPGFAGWDEIQIGACAHADVPSAPAAIAAIQAQLASWTAADGAASPVLFLGPSWTDRSIWDASIASIVPAAAATTPHFDLRLGFPASAVTAVASAYTADLDDAPHATNSELAAQAAAVVDRILELTGAAGVVVVTHSTAGLVGRALAATRSASVSGLITLATPHDGAVPAPLADPRLADAARALRDLGGGHLGSLHRGALAGLEATLDGLPGAVRAAAFSEAPAPAPALRGLAVGTALGGSVVRDATQALAAQLAAVGAAPATGQPAARPAPTHLGLGLRARLAVDVTDAADLSARTRARLDVARIRFAPDPGDAPAGATPRPDHALAVEVDLERPGGWLVGASSVTGARLRSATLGAAFTASAGGGVAVTPRIVLRDASLPGLAALPGAAARHDIGLADADLESALAALAAQLGLGSAGVDATALQQLATSPSAFLSERRDALLAAFGGPLTVPVGSTELEFSLDPATWQLRVRTASELALGEGAGLTVDARLALIGFHPSVDATLRVGVLKLEAESQTERITLAADGWLEPLDLHPFPATTVLVDTLLPLIPRVALSSAASLTLGSVLDTAQTVAPLDRLLTNPGETLAQLTGDQIQALLQAVGTALGLTTTDGLHLPGGLTLAATGATGIHLELAATIELTAQPNPDTLTIGVTLDLDAARHVDVGGTVSLDLSLLAAAGATPDWDGITVDFGVGPAGVTLAITPEGLDQITLLPQFSGFGPLVTAGVGSLLPELLQALHDELTTVTPFRTAVLAVAAELGVYDAAAATFTASAQVGQLRAMLAPGWLQTELDDPAALAGLVGALFGPGKIELPSGHTVSASGGLVRYAAQIPSLDPLNPTPAELTVETRLGEPPLVRIGLTGLDLGPLVVDEVRAGFDGDLDLSIAVHLDLPGDLEFLGPRVEFGFDGGQLRAAILPLGTAQATDLAIRLAPTPQVVATDDGLLALLTGWGVPLATLLGLRAVGTDLLGTALWGSGASAGPTPRDILEGAQIIVGGGDPTELPTLQLPLAPLDQVALGALQALAQNISVEITDGLTLSVRQGPGQRTGITLKGHVEFADEDGRDVSLRFGESWWLDDADRGVTLWVFRAAPGSTPPIALDPGLDVVGLGVVIGDALPDPPPADDDESYQPLVKGAVTVGQLGGLMFFRLDFLDDAGQPTLTATDIGAALEIDAAKITIASEDGDSIIKKLLPKELQAPFSLAVEGRTGRGVEIHGGIGATEGAIELTFPLDLDLGGIIFLRELFLQAKEEGNGAAIVAALSANATLGPIAMNVTRVGLRARIGPSGAQLEFKLPDGFGVSMDTSVIRLGGYLLVDQEHGRYVGAVEIAVLEKFSLVAVAIITTKMPDGSEGFSLLVLIAVTFPVPIPLGFGFFLGGVGGLLGLNRGIDLDRLRLGLRSGTADSILFPTDVVRRIDTIVRDLEEVFPIAKDHFLIAPMALITWSTPALITAKIGLIIEIGSPLRLAILGVIKLALPDPETPIVSINVAFLGAIDIPGSMLSFDASIYDSGIGFDDFKLSLEGDIALRVCWGATPDFVITIGGFHPSYTPAAHLRLPPMRRMSISLLKDNPRITLSTYFAITSNSVQLGAALELRLEVAGFSIQGDAGFDVLVQIVPFKLMAHMWISLVVKSGSMNILTISLDLNVEGPSPWIAKGKAKFSILFFSVEVAVEVTMGESVPTELPLASVLTKLLDALKDPAAWSATLGGGNELVTLLPPAAGDLVLDAAGQLTVQQQLMPLGRDISLFGTARPIDVKRVSVEKLKVGVEDAVVGDGTLEHVTDAFSPGAFKPLSDQEKLTAAAYEQMPSGVRSLAKTALRTDDALAHTVAYETRAFDSPPDAPAPTPTSATAIAVPDQARFGELAKGGAIGRSAGAIAQARRQQHGSVLDLGAVEERFGVIADGDLRPRNASGGVNFAAGEPTVFPRSVAEARRDALRLGKGPGFEILPEAQLVSA